MEQQRDRLVGYCSRVVIGLVASAVVATAVHTDVAAVTLLAAVMLVVLTIASVMLRDGRP